MQPDMSGGLPEIQAPTARNPNVGGTASISDLLRLLGTGGMALNPAVGLQALPLFTDQVMKVVGLGPNNTVQAPSMGGSHAQAGAGPYGGPSPAMSGNASPPSLGQAAPPGAPGMAATGPQTATMPPPTLRPGSVQPATVAQPGDTGGAVPDMAGAAQGLSGNPSDIQSIIQSLMTSDNDEEKNKWLALAKAGFATAASKSNNLFGALGEGAMAGITDYEQLREQNLKNKLAAAGLINTQEATQADVAYRNAQLAQNKAEFDQKVTEYNQMLPYDQALKKAQADYYQQHGAYYDARAMMGPGAGGGGTWRDRIATQLAATGMPPQQIALVLTGKGLDPVSLGKSIYQNNIMLQQDPDGMAKALQMGQQAASAIQGGMASDAQGGGAAAPAGGGAPAAGAGKPITPDIMAQYNDAVKAGKPAAALIQRLKEKGYDTSALGQ